MFWGFSRTRENDHGQVNGGGRGIRTPGTRKGTTVFKTAGFNRSPIPPRAGALPIVRPKSVFPKLPGRNLVLFLSCMRRAALPECSQRPVQKRTGRLHEFPDMFLTGYRHVKFFAVFDSIVVAKKRDLLRVTINTANQSVSSLKWISSPLGSVFSQ